MKWKNVKKEMSQDMEEQVKDTDVVGGKNIEKRVRDKAMQEDRQQKKKKPSFLVLLLSVIITGVIAVCTGVATIYCIEEDIYATSEATIEKEYQTYLQRKYSIYAMADYKGDFAMDELKDSNFRYGIIKAPSLENVDITDPASYVTHNFDKELHADELYIYSCYCNENTTFRFRMNNFSDYDYMSTPTWEEEVIEHIAGVYYDWNAGAFYFRTDDGLLLPYEGPVMVSTSGQWAMDEAAIAMITESGESVEGPYLEEVYNETVYYSKDPNFRSAMNYMLNDERNGWDGELTSTGANFTFGAMGDMNTYSIDMSEVEVLGIGKYVHVGTLSDRTVNTFDGNYVVYHTDRDFSDETYYVLSYVQSPLNMSAGDLFTQQWSYYQMVVYRLRMVLPALCVVFGVIAIILGLCLLVRIFRAIGRGIANVRDTLRGGMDAVWRMILILGVISILELIFAIGVSEAGGKEGIIVLWFLEKIVVYPIVLLITAQISRLQKESNRCLREGEACQVDTKHMIWDLKKIGENMSSMSEGMSVAVEDKLRSERFRTELITNVSHDIKTPLTSIISYVDLMQKPETTKEEQTEYLEVLARQSERLKKLIEDLIEASKASTGNLACHMEKMDLQVALMQIVGEYEDKLAGCQIQLMTKTPEGEVEITADPQHLQRVFDNLLGNICKYGQPGTRAYVNLERRDQGAAVIVRNTSREPLNVSSQELMQRFVQGDSSRNSDGHGLGLSIADSLMKLMGGELLLTVDGDLFKVELIFCK